MGTGLAAEVYAGARRSGGEGELAEVPRLELLEKVLAPDPTPADEVRLGDEDATIVAGATAGAARQAVELVFHARRMADTATCATRIVRTSRDLRGTLDV